MRGRWEVSDAEWSVLEPILQPARRRDGRGRPWRDTRMVLNGVLWILGTGAQWRELPSKYPPYQTCHRRFQQWVRDGKLEKILRLLATESQARGQWPLDEGFIDASFTGAKKEGSPLARPIAAKGQTSFPSPTIAVFLSQLVSKPLRRMKANPSKKSSAKASSTNFR